MASQHDRHHSRIVALLSRIRHQTASSPALVCRLPEPEKGTPMWFDHDVARFDLDRRQLLKTAAGFGLLAMTPLAFSTRVWAKPVFARYPFSLGVARVTLVPTAR